MELRQLKYFVELARTLNFSRAAERLYISQPTLSQQISALEEELNARLFIRNRRKVELSHAGQIYLEYCLQIFALLDEGKDKLRVNEANSEQLRPFVIGVDESTPHLDKQGFFHAVDTLQEKFPNCSALLKVLPYKAIFPALQNGEIDVCVSIIMQDELDGLPCESRIFGEQSIVLCVPNSFAEKHPDHCLEEAVEQLELCLSSTDQRWANNFKRLFQRMNLPFHPLYINSYNSICTYVEAGRGAMLDTEYCVSSERQRFSTATFFPKDKAKALDVLLWNQQNKHLILDEFLDFFA